MTGRGVVDESTLEEERREAAECATNGLVDNPEDRITRLACAYLLRHLRSAPAVEHCFVLAA